MLASPSQTPKHVASLEVVVNVIKAGSNIVTVAVVNVQLLASVIVA